MESTYLPVHQFMLNCRLGSEYTAAEVTFEDNKKQLEFHDCCVEDVRKWLKNIYKGKETTTSPIKVGHNQNNLPTNGHNEDLEFARKNMSFIDFQNPLDEFCDDSNMLKTALKKKKTKNKSRNAVQRHGKKNQQYHE